MTEQTGLYAKMVRVMAQLGRIPKRGRNKHFNYDFVTDGDVLDAVGAALVAEGIAFFVSFNEATKHDKGVTVGSFTLTFADSETGQTHAVNWIGEGQDTQDKGAAKAATSAVKYALLKTFLISTGESTDDPDADLHGNGHKPQVTRQAPTVATPTPDPEPDAEVAAADYPTERWHSFRDYVVATLDHYAASKHVLNALRQCYGDDYQPWTQWSVVEARACWDCLTARLESDEDTEPIKYAADDPKRPFTE